VGECLLDFKRRHDRAGNPLGIEEEAETGRINQKRKLFERHFGLQSGLMPARHDMQDPAVAIGSVDSFAKFFRHFILPLNAFDERPWSS
jgi:hypothetical protein